MKIAKWGNSLAVRLPRPVVEALDLKEGDEVEITAKAARTLEVTRDQTREEALARLKAMRKPLPLDYKFDREETNARNGFRVDPDYLDGT
jgi:antitoxin MazE